MSREAPGGSRRYFWGNTLRQALSRAARHHQVAPEELAWRPVEKRHGFVNKTRRFLIEVDPAAPRRSGALASLPTPAAAPAFAAPPAAPAAGLAPPKLAGRPKPPAAAPPAAPTAPPDRRPARTAERTGAALEPLSPPDEESALAASVAMARLLRLSGLELDVAVDRLEDRLEIRLAGSDEERLRRLGVYFLDHVGQLLPRLVKGLSGKHVLTRIDGAGLRGAREKELEEMAREAARKVLESGEPVVLEPLPPGERRVVHVFLADDPRLTTESLGQGVEKPLRIALAASPGGG
jgi:spoIIIJ-associated protein